MGAEVGHSLVTGKPNALGTAWSLRGADLVTALAGTVRIRSMWMRRRSGGTMILPSTVLSGRRPSICLSTRTTASTAVRRRSDSSVIGRCSGILATPLPRPMSSWTAPRRGSATRRFVAAFRLVGLSRKAGTGVPVIFRDWQRLGHVPPVINSDKKRNSFELILAREPLLSEERQLLQAQLGVKLSETEARLFAFACRQGGASLTDAKAVTGQAGPEAPEGAEQACSAKTSGAARRCRPVRPCRTPQGRLNAAHLGQ